MATYEIQVGEDRWRVEVPDEVESDQTTLSAFLEQTAASLGKGEGYSLGEEPVEEETAPEVNRPFQSVMDSLMETVFTMGSSAFASGAGGVATGTRLIENAFRDGFEEEENSGKAFYEDELADAVAHGQAVQNDLTREPILQGTKDNLQALNESIVGDAGRMYDSATDKLSQETLKTTKSPVLAGLAKGAPDLVLDALGLGGAKLAGMAGRHVNRPELQTLREAGVKPTVGQTIGGPAKAIEDRAVGIAPGARGAQNRVGEQWQNGVINKAMEPLGVKVEGTGVEAIEQAQRALDDAYDAARDLMPEVKVQGTTLAQDMAEQLSEAAGSVGPDVMSPIKKTYKDLIKPILKKDKISSSDLQKLESKLNDRIAKASSKGNMDLAVELRQFLQILREQAAKQSPEYAAQVQKANQAYSMFADVELAAGRAGGDAGTFTPAQLQSSVKQGTSRRAKARGGDGPIADLAKAGGSELSPVTGNSGSAERALQGGAAVGGYFLDPAVATGMLTSMLGSTRAGQALGRAGVQIAAPTVPAVAGAGMMGVPLIAAGNKREER